MSDNIILIGMPGCGKSTVGVVLAKLLGFRFLDADLVIQEQQGRLLSDILQEDGLAVFKRIEENTNLSIRAQHTVIATGGSAVYGARAMAHFREIGTVVYLKLPLREIKKRLGDLSRRGVAMEAGQSLRFLYEERVPLYEKYAHITVDVYQKNLKESAALILRAVRKHSGPA